MTWAAFSALVAASSADTVCTCDARILTSRSSSVFAASAAADAATASVLGASAFDFSASTAATIAASSASSGRPSRERTSAFRVDTVSSFLVGSGCSGSAAGTVGAGVSGTGVGAGWGWSPTGSATFGSGGRDSSRDANTTDAATRASSKSTKSGMTGTGAPNVIWSPARVTGTLRYDRSFSSMTTTSDADTRTTYWENGAAVFHAALTRSAHDGSGFGMVPPGVCAAALCCAPGQVPLTAWYQAAAVALASSSGRYLRRWWYRAVHGWGLSAHFARPSGVSVQYRFSRLLPGPTLLVGFPSAAATQPPSPCPSSGSTPMRGMSVTSPPNATRTRSNVMGPARSARAATWVRSSV